MERVSAWQSARRSSANTADKSFSIASQTEALRCFGADLGLAFQLVDDVLDGDGAVPLEGAEAVRERAVETTRRAIERLQPFARRAQPLRKLARAMAERVR